MGILDGIVEWIAEQVMNILDLITTSVLGALGCSMDTFLRYFPAAETMYQVFLALGIGLILLNWVWQLFKNYFMGAGIEAEDPIKLSIRSFLFIFLTFYAKDIVDLLLKISGTPYNWILTEDLPPLKFADFNSVVTVILGVCANGAVAIIALILVLILAWNYIKLLFEAAERYILLGVLVYTAPAAFSMGASQSTGNIFKSWCRMLGGQFFLLLMNAWCLRLFTSMVGMVQGKIPVSGASGFGTGDPSATDFYIIIGRTAARIDAHIGSKGFLCVCSLDGTYLTVISLCNVADDLIGKVSAFVQG